MKTSQRAARFRDLAAECSSLAATTPLPQMRDQYHAMARHLSYSGRDAWEEGASPQPPKGAFEGAEIQVWKEALDSRLGRRTAVAEANLSKGLELTLGISLQISL